MTIVDIWNAALSMLPHDRRVQDATENTTEALRCRDVWDRVRHQLIAKHEWGWLTHTTPLLHGSLCDESGTEYVYPRPVNAVRMIGLFDKDGRRVQATTIEHKIISNHPTGYVRYLPDCTDPNMMPPWFRIALTSAMAAELAPLMLGTQTPRRITELNLLNTAEAIKIDASEIEWSGTDGRTFAHARR